MIESIKDQIQAFIAAATDQILRHLDDVPVRERETVKFTREKPNRGFESNTILEPDFGMYFYTHRDELGNLPEFHRLYESIEGNSALIHAFRLPTNFHGKIDALLHHYLASFVCRVVSDVHKGEALPTAIEKFLPSLDDFLGCESFQVRVQAPLLHCTSAVENFAVSDGVYLKRIPEPELVALIEERLNSKLEDTDLHQLRDLEFEFERVVVKPRRDHLLSPHDDESGELFERILQAMRLAGVGAIGILYIRSTGIGPFGPWYGTRTVAPRWAKYTFGSNYEVSEETLVTARKLLPGVGTLEQDLRFSLAARRFNASYHKPLGVMNADRLIDFWVGLEALLLPDGKEGELRFKASLRLAHLIGDPTNRRDVFKRVMKSYDSRSKAVHGKQFKLDNETVAEAEEFLRQALRKCAELGFVPAREWFDSRALGETSAVSK